MEKVMEIILKEINEREITILSELREKGFKYGAIKHITEHLNIKEMNIQTKYIGFDEDELIEPHELAGYEVYGLEREEVQD